MFLSFLLAAASIAAEPSCRMAEADRAWLARSIVLWKTAETDWLRLVAQPLPDIVVFDGNCTYRLPDGDFGALVSQANVDGMATYDGHPLPMGPVSFADGSGAFVMSLPSVWRAAGVDSALGLEVLMEGVFLHEIMHTRQSSLANAAFEGFGAEQTEELSDDFVQALFEADAAYGAAYRQERDMLFAAASADDIGEARTLAGQALELMRARRARWFTDDRAWLTVADDVFLTMEGMGQWLVYRHFASLPGIGAQRAMDEARRGGRFWAQDEGLALMLVVDRLVPDWQQRAFREPEWRAVKLLAAAASR
ncbi:hypothetical protein K5P26_02370 [Sphingopyxis sp. XHP0097]|uniref:Uncharacterized protein n=1 Tax=Sphingopyxis jiangsuensis TaxID=2871171 RepID=A0ABS7MAD7_9SPHN|nr:MULTISPECIES: hypothetical protein [Sphingopyxis]MBL0768301.1 hypothetical protein [Sphingopyxis lutea]MBY4635984.1 hypothetical protein [Sphingopyxis jiangsuensis]